VTVCRYKQKPTFGVINVLERLKFVDDTRHSTSHWSRSQILFENRDFCCAVLASSAAFAVMQCLYVCVCVSVCLSRSYILSKRINISSNFFHCRVATSHTILVFPYQTTWQYSDGNPPNGGLESLKMVLFRKPGALDTVFYSHSISTTTVSLAVSTRLTNVTGTQPDRQTPRDGISRVYA